MVKVFISWSGKISHEVADALHGWLPDVLQAVTPWMSSKNIDAGVLWSAVLHKKLSTSNLGILCLTRDNLAAPWLLFEAGALAKDPNIGKVIPYRFRLKAEDVDPPLSLFQSVGDDENEMLRLLQTINRESEAPLDDERLKRLFTKHWPEFTDRLIKIETREKKEIERFRQCEKELINYPRGPDIENSFIPHWFIDDVAEEFNERNLILDLVGAANNLRKAADPHDSKVTVIRKGSLDMSGRANAVWRSVFHEARLHSPRMLAAILMVLPLNTSPLKQARDTLLDKLKTIYSGTQQVN